MATPRGSKGRMEIENLGSVRVWSYPIEYCVIDYSSIPFSLTLSIQYMMSLDKRDVLSC